MQVIGSNSSIHRAENRKSFKAAFELKIIEGAESLGNTSIEEYARIASKKGKGKIIAFVRDEYVEPLESFKAGDSLVAGYKRLTVTIEKIFKKNKKKTISNPINTLYYVGEHKDHPLYSKPEEALKETLNNALNQIA